MSREEPNKTTWRIITVMKWFCTFWIWLNGLSSVPVSVIVSERTCLTLDVRSIKIRTSVLLGFPLFTCKEFLRLTLELHHWPVQKPNEVNPSPTFTHIPSSHTDLKPIGISVSTVSNDLLVISCRCRNGSLK